LVDYPLNRKHRLIIGRAFRSVTRVDMAIDCAIEGQMGRVVVDDADEPTAFRLEVGPFCYYAGDPTGPGAHALLDTLAPYTLLMPSAPGWVEAALRRHGDRMLAATRYSFSFERVTASHLDRLARGSSWYAGVEPIDLPLAEQCRAEDHFVDLSEFDSAEDFIRRGIAFCLKQDDVVVGAAFSSLICSRGIEVSVYTDESMRRRGIATAVSCRLLQSCLERGIEANWDAANPESCKLAETLGYLPRGVYQAYYLAT
jgi:GNAT superfamily N-acetyltransferase